MGKKGSSFKVNVYKILFVISMFFLISTFFTHAATWTLNGGNIQWDNSNFLNQSFWNDSPSSGDIIKALYGDGSGGTNKTAYTTKRLTGYCDTTTMQVVNITDDTGLHTMLTTSGYILMTNTIYVFNSGTYTLSPPYPTQMTMNNCTTIIGSGNVVIKAVGGGWFNNPTALISMGANYNAIIDNITLDGNGTSLSFGIETDWTNNSTVNNVNVGNDIGYGIRIANVSHHNIFNNTVVHDIRNYAVFVRDWGYNNIISNCTVYNAGQRGIIIYDHGVNNIIENCNIYNDYYGIMVAVSSTNNIVRNIDTHNNTYGIYVDANSSYNTLDSVRSHNNTNAGIYFGNNSSYDTINNSQSYNNTSYGIYFTSSPYGIINNSKSYNNGNNGIHISASSNILINNSQSYNNTSVGIYFASSASGVVNNSQFYNNTSNGITLSSSSFGVINNTESYNNNGYGIYFASSVSGSVNNIGSYNNGTYGIYLDATSLNTKYYGTNNIFSNSTTNIGGTIANFMTGNNGLIGRSNGVIIQTHTMSWDYITNPIDNNGNYFLSWTGSFASLRGIKLYTTYTSGYSNGSGTLLQIQPVIYSGITLINSGNFDITKYIGSDTIKVTGELLGLPPMTTGLNFTVIGNSNNGYINNYSLIGDITSFRNNLVPGTATGIMLIAGDGQKRIITQLFGSTYFATHFEQVSFVDTTTPSQVQLISPSSGTILNTGNIALVRSSAIDTGGGISGYVFYIMSGGIIIQSGFISTTGQNIVGLANGSYQWRVYAIDNIGNTGTRSTTWNFIISMPSPCMSGWNNDNFLTTGFWNNSPSDNNIICALYGSGGSDMTAYTNARTSNTCNPSNMSVSYITPGTDVIPEYFTGNTIYVLFSGAHITSRSINLTGCSAIVGSGDISISSNTPLTITGTLYASSKNNIIIDGISINGRGADRVGISFSLSHYNTLHNIHVYNHVGREACGININQSWYNTLENIKANNNVGIGIYLQNGSNYNTINNSEVYVNYNGVEVYASAYNSLNNMKVYNNHNGLLINAATYGNTINNTEAYNNNGAGIVIYQGSHNTVNNVNTYNNYYGGISTEGGNNTIFNNIQTYNNGQYGMDLTVSSNNNIINNIKVYGNNIAGIHNDTTSSNNKYYGSLKIFGNTIDISDTYVGGGFIAGLGSDFSSIFSGGTLDTGGTISRDYLTNPINTIGEYMLPWTGTFASLRGNLSYIGSTAAYSYGSGIVLQKQPVIYSGTDLIASGSFDATKYIGSNTTKYTGSLLGISTTTNTTGFTVTGIANNSFINNYSLFGNIVSYKIGQGINTSTGIYFSTGDGTKRVIMQIYSGNDFATHFENSSILDQTHPSQVQLISPNSGSVLNTGYITLVRSSAIDTGVGTSGYVFEVIGSGGSILSGFTVSTGTIISLPADEVYDMYERRVYAIDNIGNTGQWSNTRNFTIDTIICTNHRNNDNFITGGFWDTNPINRCIIEALYGTTGDTNTAYTNLRSGYVSGSCLPSMTVLKTNNLQNNLTVNTIYILTGQNSIITGTINLNNCNAIISNTTGGTTFFITGRIFNNIMLKNQSKQFTIIDNIATNGKDDGYGGTHTGNDNGIAFLGATNNTVNNSKAYYNRYGISLSSTERTNIYNSQTYNNGTYGIVLGYALHNQIINTKIYNNYYGIFIQSNSHRNIINNCQIYNNELYGSILERGADYNIINNSQLYNNLDGIALGSANYTVINNTQLYNNEYGLETNGTGTTLNNVKMYNNKRSINIFASGAVIFYGNNDLLNPMVGNVANITTGYATDTSVIGVGRTDGYAIFSGNISRDRLTNPINTSGNYLLARSYTRSNLWNYKGGYGDTITQGYSYGSGTLLQIQPVMYSGTDLIFSGTFDPTRYIGSNTTKYTGSLSGISTNINTTGFTVTGIANNSFINNYSLFGDIVSYKIGQGINTSTGIYMTTSDGTKRIITQIYSGVDFATHFETISMLDTTPPTFVFANNSGYECMTGILNITNAIDTGVGLHTSAYSFDGINWGTDTNILITGSIANMQPSTPVSKNGYVRDMLLNTTGGATYAVYSFNDVPPTANDFTGSTNVGHTTPIINWVTTSNAQEGDCGNSDIIFDSIINPGTKGTCTQVGMTGIMYSPNSNETGSDTCTIQVKDNENNTINITIGRENIDTIALYCGDEIIETPNRSGNDEECDNGIINGVTCSPTYGSTCSYCSTICKSITLTGEYCGDNITNGTEQCDGELGCNSTSCTWEHISCGLSAPISIYSGTIAIITGITNHTRTIFSGINFGLPNSRYDIYNSGGYITGHTYYSGGTYQIAMDIIHPGNPTITNQCTGSITIQYCGDEIINGSEQCDDGNTDNSDGCNILCQIDNDPTATVLYTPTSGTRTSGNVLATLTGFSEPLTGINFTGHTFTGNETFTFTFSDLMGNTGNATATVTWIDKIPPTFSGATSGITYATGITLYFSDNNTGATATLNSSPYTNGTTITSNGTYTVRATDIAGNTTGITFIIQHAICGNGIVEGDELYDDGVNNGLPGHSNITCNGHVGQPSTNGGGIRLTKDICPNGDTSPSYYDNQCGIIGHNSAICRYTKSELSNAYDRGYDIGITTISPICDANLDGKVTRKQLAKMMTEFTVKIIGKQPNTKILCSFTDTKNENAEMKFYMKTACQLGLMGRESNGATTKKKFDSNGLVSRAEFGTVLSRLIFKNKYNTSDSINRYKKHLEILEKIRIMTDINKPTMKELRGYILLMMKRTNDYIIDTIVTKK